jgi:hypothetical protein
MTQRLVLSIALGALLALATFGLAYAASEAGWARTAYFLYWQGYGLVTLLPCNDMGMPGQRVCEGTPLDMVAFLAGIPIGMLVYASAIFFLLKFRR